MKRLIYLEPTEFSEDSLTERGERVYQTLRVTLSPPARNGFTRTIQPEKGIGITEEWIEDTITGLLEGLAKDFPTEAYRVVRIRPNDIRFEYAGVRGLVQ